MRAWAGLPALPTLVLWRETRMEQTVFEGAISAREEFFYPDTARGPLPAGLRLAMPLNGRPGVQLLLAADRKSVV